MFVQQKPTKKEYPVDWQFEGKIANKLVQLFGKCLSSLDQVCTRSSAFRAVSRRARRPAHTKLERCYPSALARDETNFE